MDLWTEFEGVTIDNVFALNKLLQTEGRSAFFSTFNASGESVLIRIVECHFDEDEIQARWRGVEALGHANFLHIDRFGQFLIEEDGITAVYAVFERVDANLGQVLERGNLSTADAAQIGTSIASALETLHAHGFVHEHIEPGNIFAVGETVKLRGDCVRETPEGEAGIAARRRDVHDLAVLLQQVLVGAPQHSNAARQTPPAPFDHIVSNGISGDWGLAEIQGALATLKGAKGAPAKTSKPSPVAMQTAAVAEPEKHRDAAARPISPGETAQAEPRIESRSGHRTEPQIGGHTPVISDSAARTVHLRQEPAWFEEPGWVSFFEDPVRRWMIAGALLVAVALLGWIFTHRLFDSRTAASPQPVVAVPTATATSPAPSAKPSASSSKPAPAGRAASRAGVQWRVIAFTYNKKDQAQKKASSLAQKYAELRPEVFSPNGTAPWLVTIGGAMQRDEAYALAHKARSMGLARDTYAQNYTAR